MKALLAAAVIAATPFAASAATYTFNVGTSGQYNSGFQTLYVGDELVFEIEPNNTYEFDFGISGFGAYADLAEVTFGHSLSGDYTTHFSVYDRTGPFWAATGDLATVTTGSSFSVTFLSNAATDDVAIVLGFVATQVEDVPAAVPLPAAGGLLALGVVGLGAVARRRKA